MPITLCLLAKRDLAAPCVSRPSMCEHASICVLQRVNTSPCTAQVSALVVMASKDAAHAAVGCVNGDPAAPLLVMPLLKVGFVVCPRL